MGLLKLFRVILLCQLQYEVGQRNQKLHNHDSPLLLDEVNESDVVKQIDEGSFIDVQQKLF